MILGGFSNLSDSVFLWSCRTGGLCAGCARGTACQWTQQTHAARSCCSSLAFASVQGSPSECSPVKGGVSAPPKVWFLVFESSLLPITDWGVILLSFWSNTVLVLWMRRHQESTNASACTLTQCCTERAPRSRLFLANADAFPQPAVTKGYTHSSTGVICSNLLISFLSVDLECL